MKIQVDKNNWGFFINPETFTTSKLSSTQDVAEHCVVVLKSREYVEDIDRQIVKSEYFLVIKNALKKTDKNGVKSYLTDYAVKFMDKNRTYPPSTTISKEFKTSKRLLFTVDQYDSFEMTINKQALGNRNIDEYFSGIGLAAQPQSQGLEKIQTWEVEGTPKKGVTPKYKVTLTNGEYSCSCPSYTFRKQECKHIKSVK
ncbi:MAG: SWIM zinc finger family protein [Candidatus Heimdallarchaeota archaeon]|nr:SWIM zinc finger family protein [Candidatus Heimdallarchaeota archaeon]